MSGAIPLVQPPGGYGRPHYGAEELPLMTRLPGECLTELAVHEKVGGLSRFL